MVLPGARAHYSPSITRLCVVEGCLSGIRLPLLVNHPVLVVMSDTVCVGINGRSPGEGGCNSSQGEEGKLHLHFRRYRCFGVDVGVNVVVMLQAAERSKNESVCCSERVVRGGVVAG